MENKGLQWLFDYTKFHVGVYLTLTAGYITLAKSTEIINRKFVWPAVVFIALAGFAGGVIASSITQTERKDVKDFLEEPTGPWSMETLKVRTWIYIEHTAFWIGVICVVLSFVDHWPLTR